jgi:multidrug efflux pump subunit AcrA (membrane-fusion protein)
MRVHSNSPSLLPAAPAELSAYDCAELDIRRLLRRAGLLAFLLVAGLGGWGATAQIRGAVVATGSIVVSGKRKAIQHLDGGIVAALHVRDGDSVEAGAALVTLDSRELDGELKGVAQELAARTRQIASIESELEGLLRLEAKRLVAHTRVAALQREAASLAADVARLTAQRTRIAARRDRVVISAPVAGRVLNLATHTIGGVVAANATIAEIVPANDQLIVEAKLAPKDIDQVRVDAAADVHLTGLNQRTTPRLNARVVQVSPDLVRDDKGREHYVVRVRIDERSMAGLDRLVLVPGMPAEVFIATSQRSALSFLLKPLADQLARAFRED